LDTISNHKNQHCKANSGINRDWASSIEAVQGQAQWMCATPITDVMTTVGLATNLVDFAVSNRERIATKEAEIKV